MKLQRWRPELPAVAVRLASIVGSGAAVLIMIAALEPSLVDLFDLIGRVLGLSSFDLLELAGQVVLIFDSPKPVAIKAAGTDGTNSSDAATGDIVVASAQAADGVNVGDVGSTVSPAYASDGVKASDSLGEQANPLLLPLATGQSWLPYEGWLDITVKTAVQAPISSIWVWRLTDRNWPSSGNDRCNPHYAEQGPYISQPWGTGAKYYTIAFNEKFEPGPPSRKNWLVDFDITIGSTGTGNPFSNWRTFAQSINYVTAICFSPLAGEERIMYMAPSNTLIRYDTDAMAAAPQSPFPKSLPANHNRGSILCCDESRRWFQTIKFQKDEIYYYDSVNDTISEYAKTSSQARLQKASPAVYGMSWEGPGDAARSYTLLTEAIDQSNQHAGHPTFTDAWIVSRGGGERFYRMDPSDTDTKVWIGNNQEIYDGSGHLFSQWTPKWGNGTGLNYWIGTAPYQSKAPGKLINAIGIFKVYPGDPGSVEVRFFAFTDQDGGDYQDQPHASWSPDGKLIVWKSCKGTTTAEGGKPDVFVGIMPSS